MQMDCDKESVKACERAHTPMPKLAPWDGFYFASAKPFFTTLWSFKIARFTDETLMSEAYAASSITFSRLVNEIGAFSCLLANQLSEGRATCDNVEGIFLERSIFKPLKIFLIKWRMQVMQDWRRNIREAQFISFRPGRLHIP